MKVLSVFMLFLVLKTKASFFDEFTGAMLSVENAFGKLLDDVVTDVKTSMHCTILAMENVLALNGIMEKPLSNKECFSDDDIRKDNRNIYSTKDIANEISSSISKVNTTLSNILDNDGHERLQDIRRELTTESNRLAEVSSLLRQELEKISQRMSIHLNNIDLDSDKTSLESVWNDMKILYEAEKNDKSISKEVGQVLNEALDVLQVNQVSEGKSDEDKIKTIMRELEQETNNNDSKNTINRELTQWKGEQFSSENNLGEKLTEGPLKTFRDIAKVFSQKEVNNKIDKSSSYTNSKSVNENIQTKNDLTQSSNEDSDNYSPFAVTDSEDSTKAINDAINILKDSSPTQAILDNFFAKEQGADVFENPNLFNF